MNHYWNKEHIRLHGNEIGHEHTVVGCFRDAIMRIRPLPSKANYNEIVGYCN